MVDFHFKITLNGHNVDVFYWPLATGNKINTSYSITPGLANFFIETIKDVKDRPEITLKGYDKILLKHRDKLYYFYAGDYILYMQGNFCVYSKEEYEKL